MPPSCCVIGCKSRQGQSGISFFPLPLNKPTVLTQWLIVLDRRDWIPKPASRICCLHFSSDDFIEKANQPKRLKQDAVPSVFPDISDDEASEVPIIKEEVEDPTEEEPLTPNPKPTGKAKAPVKVAAPLPDTPSQRPRRAPKVSSKMKDFILLDDIKKHTVKAEKIKKEVTGGDEKAAQELLSILEDSDNDSSEDVKPVIQVAKRPSDPKKIPTSPEKKILVLENIQNLKSKPAPSSIKRFLSEKASGEKSKGTKPGPLSKKKPLLPVKTEEDQLVYLTYDDLNPVADMTKDNILFSSDKSDDGSDDGENIPMSPVKANQVQNIPVNKIADLLKKSNILKKTNPREIILSDDSEVTDSDSGIRVLSDKAVGSHIITKVNKNFKITSPVKRKKRFKTVAEIVVRTDNTGSVPSVSIEKLTSLENHETPKKRTKFDTKTEPAVKVTPPISGHKQSEDDELVNLAERITSTIKQMKLLDKVHGNSTKLTVLITTLPPVQENELLIIKKKNTDTNTEVTKELRVAISSHKPQDSQTACDGTPDNAIPILGAFDDKTPFASSVPIKMELTDTEGAEAREGAAVTDLDDGTDDGNPRQHDHNYISPSSKGEEGDTTEEQSKEIFSKLRLSDDEISYRKKFLNKLRLLKESLKKKSDVVNKQKQHITLLEKALREERRGKPTKKKILSKASGGRPSRVYSEVDNKKSEAGHSEDEDLDDSDEDIDGTTSPITYICEPAIDVCDKSAVLPES